VTLFHARLADDEPEFVRAHLERGLAALRALDVPCRLANERANSPAEGILRQASREESGLIAIGSHGPSSRSLFGRDDVTLQILAASDRPVLVIPESAW